MDVRKSRKRNLIAILREFNTLKDFADAVCISPAHASQLKNDVRQIGDEVARRIEQKLAKPHGWMDHPHEDTLVLEQLKNFSLSPKSKAQIDEITEAAKQGKLTEEDIDLAFQFLQRVKRD